MKSVSVLNLSVRCRSINFILIRAVPRKKPFRIPSDKTALSDFLGCPSYVINYSPDLQSVTMIVPDHVFRTRITISGLANGARIDDMPISRLELNGILMQLIELKVLSVIAHKHQAVGVPGEGDVEPVCPKGLSDFR